MQQETPATFTNGGRQHAISIHGTPSIQIHIAPNADLYIIHKAYSLTHTHSWCRFCSLFILCNANSTKSSFWQMKRNSGRNPNGADLGECDSARSHRINIIALRKTNKQMKNLQPIRFYYTYTRWKLVRYKLFRTCFNMLAMQRTYSSEDSMHISYLFYINKARIKSTATGTRITSGLQKSNKKLDSTL